MTHPIMFNNADHYLAGLRRVCLALPAAAEKVSHGRPCFYTKKIFAVYGSTAKGDHDSGRYDQSMLFLAPADEVPALREDPRFFVPAYWGPSGWLGLDFRAAEVDWQEVAELITESFRLTAPARVVAELG